VVVWALLLSEGRQLEAAGVRWQLEAAGKAAAPLIGSHAPERHVRQVLRFISLSISRHTSPLPHRSVECVRRGIAARGVAAYRSVTAPRVPCALSLHTLRPDP